MNDLDFTYDPNGRRVRSLNSGTGTEKYTFTGQFIEADIGLYYFGARWYDASLGRFISEDPIKGSMISSQSQNPYVYCMNNPLRFVDPSGMMTEGGDFYGGYLQTYYGGEWHYYSAMDGSCNVSGDSYTEDHFAKQSTTPPLDNAITGNDVKKTVTKSNFFANYNFMGKNKPGTTSIIPKFCNQYGCDDDYGPAIQFNRKDVTTISVQGDAVLISIRIVYAGEQSTNKWRIDADFSEEGGWVPGASLGFGEYESMEAYERMREPFYSSLGASYIYGYSDSRNPITGETSNEFILGAKGGGGGIYWPFTTLYKNY
ncbi:MAG TPA: RHS repeat-associated core domain-containing protein [Methanofastidiosum sp.]|nr:RHS repeat-associated core domain-containing protein [Methanofastidiosum sp.]